MSTQAATRSLQSFQAPWAFSLTQDAMAYWIDAWQRSILTLDVLRERSARYDAHAAKQAPHVLKFDCELVIDGRALPRPVNYVLARIKPPRGATIDDSKRPFVIVDPRAGHGPGIGGFKPDSEIGVAFKAGHPCYFVGFLPSPYPAKRSRMLRSRRQPFSNASLPIIPRPTESPPSSETARPAGRS